MLQENLVDAHLALLISNGTCLAWRIARLAHEINFAFFAPHGELLVYLMVVPAKLSGHTFFGGFDESTWSQFIQ